METFVIYNKETGLIKNSGTITRGLPQDGSTMEEYIERKLIDADLSVVYFENIDVPDKEKYKVVGGQIVDRVPTQEEIAIAQQLEITVAIQNLLDTTAQERDYDDIFTLISYVDDPDPIFDAEGTAAKLWRSAVWIAARQIKADVIAGTRPMPTVEEVLSEMPVFTWPE